MTGFFVSMINAPDSVWDPLVVPSFACKRINVVASSALGRSAATSHMKSCAVPAAAKRRLVTPSEPTPDFSVMVFHVVPFVEYCALTSVAFSLSRSEPV